MLQKCNFSFVSFKFRNRVCESTHGWTFYYKGTVNKVAVKFFQVYSHLSLHRECRRSAVRHGQFSQLTFWNPINHQISDTVDGDFFSRNPLATFSRPINHDSAINTDGEAAFLPLSFWNNCPFRPRSSRSPSSRNLKAHRYYSRVTVVWSRAELYQQFRAYRNIWEQIASRLFISCLQAIKTKYDNESNRINCQKLSSVSIYPRISNS